MGLLFSGQHAPGDGWLLVVVLNHPSPAPLLAPLSLPALLWQPVWVHTACQQKWKNYCGVRIWSHFSCLNTHPPTATTSITTYLHTVFVLLNFNPSSRYEKIIKMSEVTTPAIRCTQSTSLLNQLKVMFTSKRLLSWRLRESWNNFFKQLLVVKIFWNSFFARWFCYKFMHFEHLWDWEFCTNHKGAMQ